MANLYNIDYIMYNIGDSIKCFFTLQYKQALSVINHKKKGEKIMTNREEWNELLHNLRGNAIQNYQKTEEYEHVKQRHAQIDEMLTTNLTEDQKVFIEEILFELCAAADREAEVVYHQGIKDGVWMLKKLGMFGQTGLA